jgi:hypothetical protein
MTSTSILIIALAWFVPVGFFAKRIVTKYYPYEPKKGINLSFFWPIILLGWMWFGIVRALRRKKVKA